MHILLCNIVNQQFEISKGFIVYLLRSDVQIAFSVKDNIFYNFLLWNLQVVLRVQVFLAQLLTSNDIQQHLQSKHLSACLLHDC